MKKKFKKNLGLIILLVIVLVFPTSLNYQARLNMRIIVTGLAIDKTGEDYQVTAQIVKTSPGNESPGTSAQIDFITDKAQTLSEAVSKLAYKAGKVSAFSHTNFVVLGKSMFEEDITKCLDYFIRDKIIKNSALLLFAGDKAEDELKKTKNVELSVGLGLQKVFLFKENEGDGLMVTLIDFLNQNKLYSKSGVASELKFHTNEEAKQSEGSSQSEGQSSTSSSSSSGEGSSEQTDSKSSAGASGSSSSSSGDSGSSGQSEQQYFDPEPAVVCFVGGKFVGKLEDSDSIKGYMIGNPATKKNEVMLQDVVCGRLNGDKIEVIVKKKKNRFNVRYENGVPVLDLKVIIEKGEINEIMSDQVIANLKTEEFEAIKKGVSDAVSKQIATCFEKTKEFGCDIFNAYEKAYKWHYNKTLELFDSPEDFLKSLKLNVLVEIKQLDY